jgi:hypothetical protein
MDMVDAFGATILSTEKGQLFNLSGSSAKDFSFDTFFPGSYASGAESLAYIGTDIIYGRQGRIESVRDTNTFGNSEADDLTKEIADIIGAYSGWTIAYNGRAQKVYMFPTGHSEAWVFNPAMRTSPLTGAVYRAVCPEPGSAGSLAPGCAGKPRTLWRSSRPSFSRCSIRRTALNMCSWGMRRATSTGWREPGRPATAARLIETTWTSKVFTAPLDAEFYDIEGLYQIQEERRGNRSLDVSGAGQDGVR